MNKLTIGAFATAIGLALGAATLTGQPARGALAGRASAAGTSGFSPLGTQNLIVIPLKHWAPATLQPENCTPEPVKKKTETDAVFKARHDDWANNSIPEWANMLKDVRSGVPRKTAAQWGAFLDTNLNTFYPAASYGQTRWNVRVLINPDPKEKDGWWPAPRSLADYCAQWVAGGPDASPLSGSKSPLRDAIERILAPVVAKDPSLLNYHRVMVIQNMTAHGGVTYGPPGIAYTVNGTTSNYTVSDDNEEATDPVAANTSAHELGHQLGLPDLYACSYPGDANPDCGGDWDIMGGLTNSKRSQFNGWSRLTLGWLGGGAYGKIYDTPYVYTDPTYWSRSYALHPLEDDGYRNVARIVRIPFGPFTPGMFKGYFLECRRNIAGDQIPAEGMVVRYVDESMASKGFTVRVMNSHNPNVPMTNGDELDINMSSAGAPRYFSVHFNGLTGDLCSVTVTKAATPPTPEPTVVPIVKTYSGIGIPDVSTGDLWVDSSKDGWSPYAGSANAPAAEGGDQPWAGHQNRIYYRVHNMGTVDAQLLHVHISASTVLSVPGCAPVTGGIGWDRTIPVVKAQSDAVGFVPWRPAGSAPEQIRIQVSPVQGRPSAGLQSTAASTTSLVTLPVSGRAVDVPITIGGFAECGIAALRPQAVGVPGGWTVSVEPAVLAPSSQPQRVRVRMSPPAGGAAGQTAPIGVALVAEHSPMVDPHSQYPRAAPPFEDSSQQIVGGVLLNTRVVQASTITVRCQAASETIRVSGQLTPAEAGQHVGITLTGPSGAERLTGATSNALGRFAATVSAASAGSSVRASWAGDRLYSGAESAPCYG